MRKKSLLFVMTLLFMLLVTINAANAQCVPPDVKPTITTAGTVSESFPPDTAVITLAVETEAKTASEAANLNAKKANNVINKIKSMINKNQGDTIQTTQYSINPTYEYNDNLRKSILTGYKVTNQVTITTKQLDIASKIIDSAIANGANQVQGIDFTIKSNEEYCKKVLTRAAQKARDEAQTVAQALGVSIIGIKQASSSCGSSSPPRIMYAKSMMAEMAAPAPTPIEAGNVQVQGTVNVDFYVK